MRVAPTPIVEAFAVNGNKNTIPLDPSGTPGAASYDEGFPAETMLPRTSGGVPPSGLDFNGILNAFGDYCAWLQGGGHFSWSADFVAQNTGYGIGAVLQSASTPSKFFYNTVANNANNPDSVITGWVPFSPIGLPTGVQTATPSGSFTTALATGAGFLELTPSAPATLTNMTGASDGQIVTVTNLSASNALTIDANANIRMAGDLILLQNNSASFRYSATLALWVALNG